MFLVFFSVYAHLLVEFLLGGVHFYANGAGVGGVMSFAALYSLGTVGLAGDVKVKQKKNEYVNNHIPYAHM